MEKGGNDLSRLGNRNIQDIFITEKNKFFKNTNILAFTDLGLAKAWFYSKNQVFTGLKLSLQNF